MKLCLFLFAFTLGTYAEQEILDVTPGPLQNIEGLEQPKIVNNDINRLFAKPVHQPVEASPKVDDQKSFQISLLPSTVLGKNPQVPAEDSVSPMVEEAEAPSLLGLVPKVFPIGLPNILGHLKLGHLPKKIQCVKHRKSLIEPAGLEFIPTTSKLTIPEFILLKLFPRVGRIIFALFNLPEIKNAILEYLPILLRVGKYVLQFLVKFFMRFIPPKFLTILRSILRGFKLPFWLFQTGLGNEIGFDGRRLGRLTWPMKIIDWAKNKLFGRNKLVQASPVVPSNEGKSSNIAPKSGLKSWSQMDRPDDSSYMIIPRSKSILPNLGLQIAYNVPQYGLNGYGYNPIYTSPQYQQGTSPQGFGNSGYKGYRPPNGMYYRGFGGNKGLTFWY